MLRRYNRQPWNVLADTTELIEVVGDNSRANVPCGQRDQQIIEWSKPIHKSGTIAVEGSKQLPCLVEKLRTWRDESSAREGSSYPIHSPLPSGRIRTKTKFHENNG